ncbi:hypothetical protein PVAND_001293 [Polypedilum vanderplanki]|uniref:Calponin-homology (CH) domain-containing protein n=1 Tax=Polypedilum vanderplanki TaxID=319348 RepID=A0A9J6BN19_POLVA|nr:hypothetical protein PVAND_001293 [Polypedilum vanderplanki]
MVQRNKEQEQEVLNWIFEVLGEPVPKGDYEEILKNGVILCKLANKMTPGSVKKIQERGTNFQLMENVQRFQAFMKKYGVPEEEIFQTADLFERRNIPQVTLSLYSLARLTQKHPEWNGPSLGPKMAEKNERTFTEEQLRAHQGELNLQMGYNKGASQAGHGGFGNTPEWLKSCEFKDPEFVQCSTTSVQGLFDQLSKGIDGLEGIETTDPMRIDRIRILQGEGPVSVNASLSKIKVTGFAQTKVVQNQVSNKDYSWITSVKLPKLRMEGNYHMNGRILVIPLNGRGKCFFEPSNMDIKFYTKTKLYAKHGHTFYNVTSCKVQFTMKGLKLRMENLFDGVKALEDSTNEYLNQNWRPVSEALKPIISKTIEDILLDLMQKIFHQIPGDFFITDLPKPDQLN